MPDDKLRARRRERGRMIISDFTKPELDMFRDACNFVGNERTLFELRSQGVPLEQIAETLDMSVTGINKISQKVNKKIRRVL